MLGYMFENRNSSLKSVIKIADCLGRSLRENVQLFSIDSENDKVSFLSESGFVIEGKYSLDENRLALEDIKIQDSDIFSDNKSFNNFVSEKVKSFVGNLHESDYPHAEVSFDNIVSLWETRLRFNDVKKKLEEKSNAFSSTQEIIVTPEFQKFLEIAPQVISWLHENKDKITNITEIKNAVKLSNSVAKAFDIPKVTLDELNENEKITFDTGTNKSIYEMLCRQELVTKELMESKQGFDLVWANNKNINVLASLIYNGDENKVSQSLSEALSDVPYLALATKKQLRETFSKSLQLENSTDIEISDRDLKTFASIIFEMKKPVKNMLIKTINEKYGVNVQNLKEVASFRGLVEAQIVIFESLSRLAPKSSVLKEVLGQVSDMLREKSGVEAIDVNDILQLVFEKSEYADLCDSYSISEEISLKEMFENDLSPQQIISLLEDQTSSVLDKIHSLKEKNTISEDETEGYPKKGIKGGTLAAKVEALKKKKDGGHGDPDTPESVQAELSGEDKSSQYAEANDEAPEEAPEEVPEEEEPISKEDFFKAIEDFTKVLGGKDKKAGKEELEAPKEE